MDPTPVARMLPPTRPAGWIARPALTERIGTVLSRRLTTVVAEAGYGKSTLLASWWETVPCAWYTAEATDHDSAALAQRLGESLRLRVPELPGELAHGHEATSGTDEEQMARADALASRLAQVLHAHLALDLLLVIDDVDELRAGSPSARLVEALCRHAPSRLHLVLAGRRRAPFPVERLRGQGQLLEIGGEQLAFTPAEVATLVEARLGTPLPDIAEQVFRLAGGWPAAVVLALEALRESPPEAWPGLLAGPARPTAPLFAYLTEEVMSHQPASVRQVISRAAIYDQFTPEMCLAVGIVDSRASVAELAAASLFVESRPDGSLALRPLVREYALQHLPLPAGAARELRLAGAEWLAGSGSVAAAMRMLITAAETDPLLDLVEREGPALLSAGEVATVLQACAAIPPARRTPSVDELEGEARQIQGDWTGALACFERASRGIHPLSAHLAWRIGLIHYLRGQTDAALGVFRQGLDDDGADPTDMGLLLAWTATTHWLRGEVESCRSLAGQALAIASASGNRRTLAAAHTVMAMLAALDGDRRANDAHYLLALHAAEEAGDLLQMVRIRSNRGSHFMEEGSYLEALQELDVAIGLAEVTSFATFLALSLCNRGETRLRMGRLDEALSDLEASRDHYQRFGIDMVAYPLALIGEVYRERGNLAQARAAYEEAASIAETSGDQQGLVPALAGLATVIAGEEPERAHELVGRAVSNGTGLGYVSALLAAGWVAAVAGDRQTARDHAARAAATARSRRDRAGLAEALALEALVAENPRRETRRLHEAAAIYREVGNPLGEAKVMLALASVEPGPGSTALRHRLERQLDALGVHGHRGGTVGTGLLALLSGGDATRVAIQSLGRFAVHRGGELVRPSAWQSRRARELLKLLVSRRGRPVSRDFLMDTLWPDEEPDRVANRLSVALTTIRGVFDAERRSAVDHLISDKDSVALNTESVDVDLERFHASAADGLASLRRGDVEVGVALLEDAAATYSGDFLEDNPYDDWAVAPREEARAVYVAVVRALADEAVARSDADGAVRQLLRILESDRFDEQAHLSLVATLAGAGRHGEAHRHYLTYRRAMDELGVEPAPFPAPAGTRDARPTRELQGGAEPASA
jgi:ATP/maltotriose-dependent transcriptional regulator MalT/DNA-binding SARP family transcriptional activator